MSRSPCACIYIGQPFLSKPNQPPGLYNFMTSGTSHSVRIVSILYFARHAMLCNVTNTQHAEYQEIVVTKLIFSFFSFFFHNYQNNVHLWKTMFLFASCQQNLQVLTLVKYECASKVLLSLLAVNTAFDQRISCIQSFYTRKGLLEKLTLQMLKPYSKRIR